MNDFVGPGNVAEPGLVRKVRWFLPLAATLTSLVFILAPFNIGTYTYYGRTVTGPEFLARAWIPAGALLGTCIVLSIGLWLRKSWVRPVFLLLLAGAFTATFVVQARLSLTAAVGDFAIELIPLGLCGWYLYGQTTAREYFDALKQRGAA